MWETKSLMTLSSCQPSSHCVLGRRIPTFGFLSLLPHSGVTSWGESSLPPQWNNWTRETSPMWVDLEKDSCGENDWTPCIWGDAVVVPWSSNRCSRLPRWALILQCCVNLDQLMLNFDVIIWKIGSVKSTALAGLKAKFLVPWVEVEARYFSLSAWGLCTDKLAAWDMSKTQTNSDAASSLF